VKIIALERGLDELKQFLDERGYNTVYADEADTAVSVYIYQEQNALGQISLHSSLNNTTLTDQGSSGILLIQARDKTPEQVVAMIENRLYSPLFYY
jgi:hypothetical protein